MFERCLYFNTNALTRKLNSIWEEAFSQFDLPPSHAYLLRLVLESPGQTQQELARELSLNKSTVNRFVVALEKKNLLVRESDAHDQREKRIKPSGKAMSIHRELEKLGKDLYLSMCSTLGKKYVESFVNAARNINKAL